MRWIIRRAWFLLALLLAVSAQAQPILRLTDLTGQPVADIREGQRIICSYQLPNQYTRLIRGRLLTITDSTITYRISYAKASQEIPLSAIQTINRIRIGKYILPSIGAGVIVGVLDVWLNRRNSTFTSSLLLSGGVLAALRYNDYLDRRRLAKLQVGKTVNLAVVPFVK
ncbi:hypothetical protein [Spirosoma flavus]